MITGRIAVIACGALARHVHEIAALRGLPLDVHPLPPLLHNRPSLIAPEVERLVRALRPHYGRIVIAYADCGTYGALDEVCARHDLVRLRGRHCYELFSGEPHDEPGTFYLTDYLVRTFHRSVVVELGLDRYPSLRDDYFRNYRQVVWLAQKQTPELHAQAVQAATFLGLPLKVRETGDSGLEHELLRLTTA